MKRRPRIAPSYWWFAVQLLAVPIVVASSVRRSLGLFALGLCLAVAGQLVYLLKTVRLRRRVLAAGGLLCPECGFDLSAAGPNDAGPRCPECGSPFESGALRRRWAEFLPSLKFPTAN